MVQANRSAERNGKTVAIPAPDGRPPAPRTTPADARHELVRPQKENPRMSTEIAKATADIDVPVPIVGGGGAGLTCSMLLAQLGIETFNEVGSPPTDEALTRQFECLRRATGAAQVSQSAER